MTNVLRHVYGWLGDLSPTRVGKTIRAIVPEKQPINSRTLVIIVARCCKVVNSFGKVEGSVSDRKSNYGGFLSRLGVIGELFSFLWQRKLWWLIPMIVVLILFMVLIMAGATAGVGPFIYTLW